MNRALEVLHLIDEVRMREAKSKLTLLGLYHLTDRFTKLQPSRVPRIPPPHQWLKILQWKMTPMVGMKSLIVSAIVESGSGDKPKKTVIQFFNVKYVNPEEVKGDPRYITIQNPKPISRKVYGKGFGEYEIESSKLIAFKKLDARIHPVQVRCSCEDFYFRFAWYLMEKGALYGGKVKPYKRKTTTWPSVNKYHIPAICKHLWNVVKRLEQAGILY